MSRFTSAHKVLPSVPCIHCAAIANLNGVQFMGQQIRVALSKHNEVAVSRNEANNETGRVLSKDFYNSPLHRFRVAGSRNYQVCARSRCLSLAGLGHGEGLPCLLEGFDARCCDRCL